MEGFQVLDSMCKVLHSQLHSVHHSQLHSHLCSRSLLRPRLPLETSISLLAPHILSPPACASSLLADLVSDALWALSKLCGKYP